MTPKQSHTCLFLVLSSIWIAVFTIAAILTVSPCRNCDALHTFQIALASCSLLTMFVWAFVLYKSHYGTRVEQHQQVQDNTFHPITDQETTTIGNLHYTNLYRLDKTASEQQSPFFAPAGTDSEYVHIDDESPSCPRSCSACCYSRWGAAITWTCFLYLLTLIWMSVPAYFRLATLPQLEGELKVPGLDGPSFIRREKHGLIHVEASTMHDIYFTQGFAVAQERLWQIEFQRRLGSGRLCEVVGDGAIDIDKLMRTLGIHEAAVRAYATLDQDSKAVLQAYVGGINAYLDTQPRLPLEFVIFNFRSHPWVPTDVIVWSKIMAFSLSLNLNKELERFHLLVDRKLDSTRVARLMPEYDSSRFPTALSEQDLHHLGGSNSVHDHTVSEEAHHLESERIREFTAANAAAEPANTHFASSLRSALDKLKRTMGPSRASNDWVVHGNLTSTGKPIMCNDPHLQLTAPSVWILFHLQVPQQLNVIGSSFAGIPGVVLGRNDHISWAVTNVGADVQDLYMMQEQPGNSSFYLYRGQYVPYTIREEIIKVSGGADVVLRVRSSVYGPVVTDIDEDYLKRETKTPLSLRWVALDANVTAVEGFYRMSLAHNYSEFREAVRFFRTPSQNLVYADVEGNIAYQMNGVIPIRAPNHSGLYPVPGNGDFDWQGFIPYDELPRTFNPPEGFIATANNRITPDSYAHFIASDWDAGSSGYRALRITQEIRRIANTSSRVTPRSMQALQNDRVSLDAFDWMVLLQRISPASLSQVAASWRSKLLAWDGNTLPGSLETSVYVGWLRELSRLPAAEVGTNLWLDQTYLQNVLIRHQSDPNCVSNSTAPDSCLAFASRAFETAVAAHSEQEWSRDVHPLVLAHPVLNNTPIECLVNRRVAHGGTDETINVGSITFGTKEWVQQHGPSYRAMYDLSAPEASQFVLPGGESGSIFSPFYDNMLKNWLHGRYEKMQTRDFKTRFELRLSP